MPRRSRSHNHSAQGPGPNALTGSPASLGPCGAGLNRTGRAGVLCVMRVCVVEQKNYNFSHYPLAVSILLTKYILDCTSLGEHGSVLQPFYPFPP